jgi:hypothetical protein
VRITDANGCVFMYSAGYHYSSTTGVNELATTGALNIFPNPSTSIFTIENSGLNGKDYMVNVYDAMGNLVVTNKNSLQIDMSSYSSGIYYAVVRSEAGILNRRISIVR